MHEVIKLDAELNTMLYTNLKEKFYDKPIIFGKTNVVLNSFDQLTLTLAGVGIEVFSFKNIFLKQYKSKVSNLLMYIDCN